MFKIDIPSNLPPVKNVLVYSYRSIGKLLATLYLLVGSMVIAFMIFPFIRLFSKDKNAFNVKGRRYVSNVFKRFLFVLGIGGIVRMKIRDKEAFKNVKGKIIVANHPSLLDFVCMTALFPGSNCIVRNSLKKTPFTGIISQVYITNADDLEELLHACKEDLDNGNNVLIFPEGTRTPRFSRNVYQKGAARIALYAKCDIQPVFIGGSDKYGLGKHDPLFSFNPVERYVYDFRLLPEIKISDYEEVPAPAAAKRITCRMEEDILAADADYRKTNPEDLRTFNNV